MWFRYSIVVIDLKIVKTRFLCEEEKESSV